MPSPRSSTHPLVIALGLAPELIVALSAALERRFGTECLQAFPDLDAARAGDGAQVEISRADAVLCSAGATGALSWLGAEHPEIGIAVIGPGSGPDPTWMTRAIELGAIDAIRENDLRHDPAPVLDKLLKQCELRRAARGTLSDLRTTAAQLKARNDRLEQELIRLETMAWTDPLTGLANRRQMQDRLPQLFAQSVRYQRELSCLMIDLDGFKAINDTNGHARGDSMLAITARVIQSGLRGSDFAARYGGDEFVVLMPLTSARIAASVARRLREAFMTQARALLAGNSGEATGGGCACGMSIGIASIASCHALDGEGLIACADAALYAAKAAGKGSIMLCTPEGRFTDVASLPAEVPEVEDAGGNEG